MLPGMELIETHCHLYADPLAADAAGVLARARAAGVAQVVVPAYDLASWGPTLALARQPGVRPALGLHPWVAHEPLDAQRLLAGLRDSGAVAVGEIGLDHNVPQPEPAVQAAALRLQLRAAAQLDLPVILHCRGAFEPLLALLEADVAERAAAGAAPLRGVVHAFSRGPELAARFLALGLHLGFGGALTRDGSRARRAAATAPLERIVLETDAPSIGLAGVPTEQTEPRHVLEVARALAGLRGVDVAHIAEVTTANARQLFHL